MSFKGIFERIRKEGLAIICDEYKNCFSLVNYSYITYPKEIYWSDNRSIFPLTHELGHYILYKKYPSFIKSLSNFFNLVSQVDKYYIIAFLWVFFEEVYAWVLGYYICKEESITTNGFVSTALFALVTYFKAFIKGILGILKYLLGLYLSVFFLIKFLVSSNNMNVSLYKLFEYIRATIINSEMNNTQLISRYFGISLTFLLIYEGIEFGIVMFRKYYNFKRNF